MLCRWRRGAARMRRHGWRRTRLRRRDATRERCDRHCRRIEPHHAKTVCRPRGACRLGASSGCGTTGSSARPSAMCPGWDSNPHAARRHPLKMVCLPVPPPGRIAPPTTVATALRQLATGRENVPLTALRWALAERTAVRRARQRELPPAQEPPLRWAPNRPADSSRRSRPEGERHQVLEPFPKREPAPQPERAPPTSHSFRRRKVRAR